jgi:hypothetical protein
MKLLNNQGQAIVEYIFLFAMMSFIGMNLARGLSSLMNDNIGGIGYVLTNKLSSGVCESLCFFSGYKNL